MTLKKTYKDIKKFTVKRSKWYRGKGPDKSALLTNDGMKCCLGFYATACGLQAKDIKRVKSPGGVVKNKKKAWKSILIDFYAGNDKLDEKYVTDSSACEDLMEINDEEDYSESQREDKLTKLFDELGIKVKFID